MEYVMLFRVFFCVFLCGTACAQSPQNAAVLLGSSVDFACVKPTTATIIWKLYKMSTRPADTAAEWPAVTVAIGGNLQEPTSTKYTVNTAGNTETLQIMNLESADAAVVECEVVNQAKLKAQLVVLEPPSCSKNISGVGHQYEAGEFVAFTCTQIYHTNIWAPRMDWFWVSPNTNLLSHTVDNTDSSQAEYSVVLEMLPEYNGRQLRCDITYDALPTGSYTDMERFASNTPSYNFRYTTEDSFSVLYEVTNYQILNSRTEYNPTDQVTCVAEGNPEPIVQWIVGNGMSANAPIQTSGFTVSAILTITEAMEGNHTYTCNASNSFNTRNKVISETIDFTVVIPTVPATTQGPSSGSYPGYPYKPWEAPVMSCEQRGSTQDECCPYDRCGLCKLQTGAHTCFTEGQAPSLCSSDQCPANSALSTGAIVGIVIGVLILIILVLLLLYCCCFKQAPSKGKQQNNQKPKSRMDGVDTIRKPDVYAVETPPPYSPYAQPAMHHPPNNEGLSYANLALDDTPRSRKPIQVYEPVDYDLQRV